MSDKLRFAIFGNEYQSHKSVSAREVIDRLVRHGAEVCIEHTFHNFLEKISRTALPQVEVFDSFPEDADYVISIGGDGTFLKTAAQVGIRGIPIIGVNAGRLGFLSDVMPTEISAAVDDIFNGRITIEEHVAISMDATNENGEAVIKDLCALNDIALLKHDNASMISIHTLINGKPLTTYQADGLVIATPTGSTAYNLSNGGPIMVPESGIICLTAVAPHSLNIRPIVISDDSIIELRVESRSHHYLAAIDGRSENLSEGTVVTIRKAPYKVKVLRRSKSNYFDTLRNKLMWGVSTLNTNH